MKDKAIQVRCSPTFKHRLLEAAKYYNLNISTYIVMLVNKNLEEIGK